MKTETAKVTKRMYDFLFWMHRQGQIKLFPVEWGVMYKKAKKQGFIEEAKLVHDHRGGLFMTYQISAAGKAAINV